MEHWKTRFENCKLPRGCQHGDHGRNFETIRRRAHTMIVHVSVCVKGSKRNTQKGGVNKEIEGWTDKRESRAPAFC